MFCIPGGNEAGWPGKYDAPDNGEIAEIVVGALSAVPGVEHAAAVTGIKGPCVDVGGVETVGGLDEGLRTGLTVGTDGVSAVVRDELRDEAKAIFAEAEASAFCALKTDNKGEFWRDELCKRRNAACWAARSSKSVRFVCSAVNCAVFDTGRLFDNGDDPLSDNSLRIISGLSAEFSSPDWFSSDPKSFIRFLNPVFHWNRLLKNILREFDFLTNLLTYQ